MRLDRYLSNMGKGTRTEIKKEIQRGHVLVNEVIQKKVGSPIKPAEDDVVLNGEKIVYESKVYLMLHKPQGVISATEDKQHKTVIDLIHGYGNRKLFPVGRLDKDTEGLILITDDGDFNHQLMSPSKHVTKCYYADVEGLVDDLIIKQFKEGVVLDDGYVCKSAVLELLGLGDEQSEIRLTITEGKYHQVKRMFEAVDMEVLYLKREKIGALTLGELPLGEFRKLSEEDFKKIKP